MEVFTHGKYAFDCTRGTKSGHYRLHQSNLTLSAQTRDDSRCRYGGALVQHHQVVDGLDTLPDEDPAASQYRDDFACPGLQHETGYQLAGSAESYRDDRSIGSFVSKKITSNTKKITGSLMNNYKVRSNRMTTGELSHSLGQKESLYVAR